MSEKIPAILKENTDLNTRDIKHIGELISKNLPFGEINIRNTPWLVEELVTASAYLYSKCPGNSDNVISFKDSNYILKQKGRGMSLISGIKKVKELGFIPQFCVVTSTLILRNMKRDSDVEYFKPIFDKAIEFSETEKVRENRQGKSPVAVASACFYIAAILVNRRLTQKIVADMFGVVEVTVRNRYQAIAPDSFDNTPIRTTVGEKVMCGSCVHLGDKYRLKTRESPFNYYPYRKNKPNPYRYVWKCLGNGSVFSHISSLTYKRVCEQFVGKGIK